MTDDEAEARLLDALATYIATTGDGPVMVTSYVAVANFTDAAGEVAIFIATPETQRDHETLGLLEFARLRRARDAFGGDQ